MHPSFYSTFIQKALHYILTQTFHTFRVSLRTYLCANKFLFPHRIGNARQIRIILPTYTISLLHSIFLHIFQSHRTEYPTFYHEKRLPFSYPSYMAQNRRTFSCHCRIVPYLEESVDISNQFASEQTWIEIETIERR